jgi:hypothetical protein
MAKGIKHPKIKSTPAARRLIYAALRRCKNSQRGAARLLLLPNAAQLNKMKRGLIGDTPSMKAALRRADDRARRAWLMIPADPPDDRTIDGAVVHTLWCELKALTKRFEVIMQDDKMGKATRGKTRM